MDNGALEQLRARYEHELPFWTAVVETVKNRVAGAVRSLGIKAEIDGRPKELPSLVRKAITKERVDLAEFHDKAGVRVVTLYPEQIAPIAERIKETFDCRKDEDKSAAIAKDALDYLGRHLDVVLDPHDVPSDVDVTGEAWCEIQLHTLAQTLWAQTCHPLLYKAPFDLPAPTERALWRLVALSEIVDDELARARGVIMSQPGYETAMLTDRLEKLFFSLVGRDYDGELTQLLIDRLAPLFNAPMDEIGTTLEDFVTRKKDKLEFLYSHNASVTREPFLFQPEGIMILCLLEQRRDELEEAWIDLLPLKFLESFAATWGEPIG